MLIKKIFKGGFFKLLLFFVIIAGVIILRIYAFDVYKIPTDSMVPCLQSGDFILVSKMSFGPRVINIWKLFFLEKIEYHWYKGWSDKKKGDVFVFNLPQYWTLIDKYPDLFGNVIVKRCYGMPGDTITINNKKRMYSAENETKTDLFPHDSILNWEIDNYGPLRVPGKGKPMLLTPENARHYQDVLLYEGCKTETRNDSVYINSKYCKKYTFTSNFYFMKGDNFYNSQDSRYWGFLPEKNVIGKAVLVLFSIDPYEPWHKCFKWKRFLKKIE